MVRYAYWKNQWYGCCGGNQLLYDQRPLHRRKLTPDTMTLVKKP